MFGLEISTTVFYKKKVTEDRQRRTARPAKDAWTMGRRGWCYRWWWSKERRWRGKVCCQFKGRQ